MTDYTQERDRELGMAFAASARALRQAYREWIQEELNDLAARADSLEPALQGPTKNEMQRTMARIRDINQAELREAVEGLQGRIKEIEEQLYDGVLDARQHLNEGITGLEGLVRELLHLRKVLDELWDSHTGLRH